MSEDLRDVIEGHVIERGFRHDEDRWWEPFDEASWKNEGDGQSFMTVHHRTLKAYEDKFNKPGTYTQIAFVYRTDGEGEPYEVHIVTGKTVEIITDDFDEDE